MAVILSAKQPSEEYAVEFKYEALLGTATIASSDVVVLESLTRDDVTATLTDSTKEIIGSKSIFVWVEGGETGKSYVITVEATASDGSVYELDAILPVHEISDSIEPVSLTEAKLHLRLAVTISDATDYTVEDAFLRRLIMTARHRVESLTGRALIRQIKTLYMDQFPSERYILVPNPPLVSATMTYKTRDETTTDFTDFDADVNSTWGRLTLKPDKYWPTDLLYPVNPITISYVCGYGNAEAVPEGMKAAMLLIVSDLYENRGEVLIGVMSHRISRAIDSLLDDFDVRRPWG